MERFAICVNDVEQARRVIVPLLGAAPDAAACLLLPCAPGLGQRIGRWTLPAARQAWRAEWADQLRGRLAPVLDEAAPGVAFDWRVPQGSLAAFTRRLRQQQGAGLRLIDARSRRPGAALEPMSAGEARHSGRLAAPVAVASSLSLMLALTD